jgi:hypothetical protein
MKAGMTLLKYYENHIVHLKYEELLQFLINDLVKSGFFQNANFEKFVSIFNSINIKTALVNHLEHEHSQNLKIKEIEEKLKSPIQLLNDQFSLNK